MEPRQAPTSTYRLQLTSDFTLQDAAALVPYLRELGVDWVYVSPVLEATPGSTHGYDLVAHDRIDAARGGADGLAALAAAAHGAGMGVLVDIVPNHMGVSVPDANGWWWSVLAEGPASPYAPAFDIDWDGAGGRLRIPVVGDDDLLPDGRIANLSVEGDTLRYHDHRYPLRRGSDVDGTPDEVHAQQHYELIGWRRADQALNYRRFFAISDLAGVRVEDPEWFDASHVEIARWFEEGLADGLRIDHPDGLREPGGYLERLAGLTDGAWVLVEKILHHGEELPASWRCAGTTGYDALAQVERVLVDPAGQASLDAVEADLCGDRRTWAELVHDQKRRVADTILGSEVRRVVRDVLGGGTVGEEPDDLVDAVAELAACFPVYRSYLPEGADRLSSALTEARRRRPDLDTALDRLEPVLGDPEHPAARRFEQTTGAVTAKGVEDTAFFRYNRLTSLNEVGGDPDVLALSVTDFHVAMAQRQDRWPESMTTLTTHDTKRGEDTRARITALAEVADLWRSTLPRLLEAAPVAGGSFGSLLWQAIVGAWRDDDPDLRARLHAYAEKAMREASEHTTWADPDEAYERSVHAAVDAAFDDPDVAGALRDLLAAVVDAGWSNALSAKLVQLTMPGIPDVYQGSELWEQSLVDPDNRRPVDFTGRAALLSSLSGDDAAVRRPAGLDDHGEAKLLLTARTLRLRRARPELFASYAPVGAEGEAAGHVVAFDRGGAVTVATRLPIGLEQRGGWGDTVLELAGGWRDVLTDRRFGDGPRLAELLDQLPVALLVQEDR
ncbi:malto-oligosyltrehalose synthase [Nocardioides sp. SYSU DS0651]|uniref:malto-oligosyltrehalose synthase n=1 Tax=Nocardioides sp. SYSU DS0651 TaxID=3415955 RepID=UPI003F4B601C